MRSNRPPSTISGLSGGGVMGMRGGNNKEVEIEVPWTNVRGRESVDDVVSVNSEAKFGGPGNVDGN